MFTGLIRGLGRLVAREALAGGGARIRVEVPVSLASLSVGASLALDGCCLTVALRAAPDLHFDLSPETLARTRFGGLNLGARINLEPPLCVGDPLDGHWVTGHVDGLARFVSCENRGGFADLVVEVPASGPGAYRAGLVAEKGSIALNGVSLTVASWDAASRRVGAALIPETLARTNLVACAPGEPLHLEYDLLARYALEARLL